MPAARIPDPITTPAMAPVLLGAALVAAGSLLFSGKSVLVKHAYTLGADPLDVLALRYVIAAPVFVAIGCVAGGAWSGPGTRDRIRDAASAAAIGVIGYHVASWLDFVALRSISVGLERMVLYLYPTFVALAAAAMQRRAVPRAVTLALAGTYAGIALTWGGEAASGPGTATGVALVAGSAACYAAYVLLGDGGIARLGASRFTAIAMVGASCSVLVHAFAARGLAPLGQPGAVWIDAVVLGLLGTVAPALLLSHGQRRIGAARAAVIGTVGPCGTALIAWAALGERPTTLAVAGIILTLASVTALSLAKTPSPADGAGRR